MTEAAWSPVEPHQLGFLLDTKRCSGCMACMVACMDENDLPGGRSFRQVVSHEEASGASAKITFASLGCSHCGDAPCLTVCPTGAIYKKAADGIVMVDQARCIGCHSCLTVCPFGAPQFLGDGLMHKCDLCHRRLGHHLDPACVRVCPTGALDFGSLAELSGRQARHAGRRILTVPPGSGPDGIGSRTV